MPMMMRAFVFLLLTLLAVAPARAEWLRAESRNFVLYSEGSESRLRERIALLEDFDQLLRIVTTVQEPPSPTKFHVYLVPNRAALQSIRNLGPGIAGFYTATPYGVAAFVDASAEADGNIVLFHEYAHHFMHQYAANAYPAWYVEGFADYFATARITDRTIDIGNFERGRAYSITDGQWLPMEGLLFGTSAGLAREQRAQFYAQAWLVTHYFFSTPERQAALRRLLVASRASTPQEGFRTATGFTPDAFRDELRRYIRGGQIRYRRMERERNRPEHSIEVRRLGAVSDEVMLADGALRVGVNDEEEAALLQRVRAAIARQPDDPVARRVAAQAEALFGEAAAADRLLDPLIAASPNDAELMYWKGMRYLRGAREGDNADDAAAQARIWLARAYRANDSHYQTLYRYSQALRGRRDSLSENSRNIMLLAHQLAPQVDEIRLNTASMLIARGDTGEAIALLRPLAASPHNPSLAQVAQRLIDQARARAEPTAARPGS